MKTLIFPEHPTAIRIHIEGNCGTPIIAEMIGRILTDKGAKVTFTDSRCESLKKPIKSLKGLNVVVDRITWVRNEEVSHWLTKGGQS